MKLIKNPEKSLDSRILNYLQECNSNRTFSQNVKSLALPLGNFDRAALACVSEENLATKIRAAAPFALLAKYIPPTTIISSIAGYLSILVY